MDQVGKVVKSAGVVQLVGMEYGQKMRKTFRYHLPKKQSRMVVPLEARRGH